MGCPWLPYCMLLLSPQINREHKFHPGPGPADTLPSPVRFLKISRKEDGMRWSRSCWYNQKKLYPGEILEFLYLCGIVLYPLYFFLFTDSFMLPIARVGQSDKMRYTAMKWRDDTNTPHSPRWPSAFLVTSPRAQNKLSLSAQSSCAKKYYLGNKNNSLNFIKTINCFLWLSGKWNIIDR